MSDANTRHGEVKSKDDELFSARLIWHAFDNTKHGKLELEPYFYYNVASDQRVDIKGDTKTELGAYGLSVEYKKANFEIGGEKYLIFEKR